MSILDHRFSALSDPVRRSIVERLGQGEATVRELGGIADISQPALSHHLKVLEECGLIETRVAGQTRPRRLRPGALSEMQDWLRRMQMTVEENYQRLDAVLAADGTNPTDRSGKER